MSCLDTLHGRLVFARRVRVLAGHLAALLPHGATVLDIGCGDGRVARAILDQRPDVRIEGLDVLIRPQTYISVKAFDGRRIPCADGQYDVALFVDVLHHTEDPMILLREAVRVARRGLLIKDHCLEGWLAGPTLRFMDWVGNARHGVALPYHYWPWGRWQAAWAELRLRPVTCLRQLHLYPPPATWFFDRSLHFMAWLEKENGGRV
ncbi:MAG: class I SAM-dependent methyltransferase [Verrucomicrobiae bacterium]|nr:class I SAM-dependent methyltransferase [Verrucomicrobiae bacterium]